ncbi:asparagine synthetase [glutamine-hydrolyzing]-like isoform X2 [Macrosteles quadrilineatus]|nr:asparagine synthetase [glutamine-hydrolyzing]-like isoform X2 [Macrosteles quadrilineatus]XP_054271120.1 asparagine synthetase [glutamine-hydrolyzing]-like isoform X2 [Macrosteles quadrilineatus]XP_054272099.1 asparagine synthetase [glutamine-hydrolyzing]-like isoform X2 [Macrosteles quadrilineatus]
MCGIWALFGVSTDSVEHTDRSFAKIKHRGPDAWKIQYDNKVKCACLGFMRLTIIDNVYGMQPMILHNYPHLTLLCNGELYNYKRLGEHFKFEYETRCDVECITHLFATRGIEFCVQHLDGVFGFVLVDSKTQRVYVGRDPFGVRPLFRIKSDVGIVGFCSEAKGLMSLSSKMNGGKWTVEQFPPGHFAEYQLNKDGTATLLREQRYYSLGAAPAFQTLVPYSELSEMDIHGNIRKLLTAAVQKRLMAERRIGCFLSGGLDSSLVAALVVKLAKEANLPYKIQTFAIGMGESPDILAARKVAQHIGSEHHEISFSPEDIAEALDHVIYSLETADITTVRASVGMYLISRYVKTQTDTTVVMSGEGADELAQGYIYFRDAPSAEEGHRESLRLLHDIHKYDGLRADRTTSAHSLELRVPFLDLQFTQYYLSLPGELRQPQKGVEKHLLRSAFNNTGLLPDNILWRHKEAFSDGVASIKKSLFQVIQELVEEKVSDESLQKASAKYPHCTPKTKEALYYREVFEKHYAGQIEWLMPYFWMPKWTDVTDPSARFIKHYAAEDKA